MSDTPGGPGWWRASDGKWYPPETHPDARPTAPPPGFETVAPASTPEQAATGTPNRWVLWVAGGLVALLVGAIVLAVAASGGDDDSETSGGGSGQEGNGSFVATASPEPGAPDVTPTSAVDTTTTTEAPSPTEPPPTEPPVTDAPPDTEPDTPPTTEAPTSTDDPGGPLPPDTTSVPPEGVDGDPELVDDIGPCQVIDADSFITDVTNGGAERISYVLDYDLVDATGAVIDTETAFISPLAPGERALDRQFLFAGDTPADCVLTAVDSFPSPPSPDVDHVTCEVTGIDTFDSLVVEFTITNLGTDTADYSFSVAIVREGLRRGVSFGNTEALPPGETVVVEGFTFEPGPVDGASCVPIDLFRS